MFLYFSALFLCLDNEDLTIEKSEKTQLNDKKTELIIRTNDLTEWTDPKIDESTITSIYSWSNDLKAVPDEISRFNNLQYAWILSRSLEKISTELGKLPNLKKLLIGSLTLNELNGSIIHLKNLKELKISYDKIHLEDNDYLIDFENKSSLNEIKELIFDKDDFKNLDTLEIKIRYRTPNNQIHFIKSLPIEICELSNLKLLEINNQKLETLPDDIGKLKNLKSLDLGHCYISTLPDSFYELTNLEELNLIDHNLKEIKSDICNFKNLKYLNLGRINNTEKFNKFSENIDFDFSKLKQLAYLNLNQLYVKRIHKSILELKDTIINIRMVDHSLILNDEGEFIGRKTLSREFSDKISFGN